MADRIFDSKIYDEFRKNDEFIKLMYDWYRFPKREYRQDLLKYIPYINSFYPEQQHQLKVYRGYRMFNTPSEKRLRTRDSNWHGLNPRQLIEKETVVTKIEDPTSFSTNTVTATIFSSHGDKSVLLSSTFTVPSDNILIYTPEIYRAMLRRFHIRAISSIGMDEIVLVPNEKKPILLECLVEAIAGHLDDTAPGSIQW